MEWFDPSPYIENSNRITDIFGYWPIFHDAWVHRISLSIADGEPWVPGSVSPVLDMLIHVFEMTKEVTKEGHFVLAKHTLVHLQFRNVTNLKLADFSYQNSIFEMAFGVEPMSFPFGGGPIEGLPPNVLTVNITSSRRFHCEFKCESAEVISADPCDAYGKEVCGPQ
jgi:hypothetical protein